MHSRIQAGRNTIDSNPGHVTIYIITENTYLFFLRTKRNEDEHHILLITCYKLSKKLKSIKKERLGKNGDGVQTYE